MTSKLEGVIRAIYFPSDVDERLEETRKKMRMNRSRFVCYAVMRLLEQLGMLSPKIEEAVEVKAE